MKGSVPSRDFEPTDAGITFAETHGLDLCSELEWWLDWCHANGRTYLDHQAAFRTWLRRAVQYGRGRQSAPIPPAPTPGVGMYRCPLGLGCDNGWVPDTSPTLRCECLGKARQTGLHLVKSGQDLLTQRKGAPAETEAPNPTLFGSENGSQGSTAAWR